MRKIQKKRLSRHAKSWCYYAKRGRTPYRGDAAPPIRANISRLESQRVEKFDKVARISMASRILFGVLWRHKSFRAERAFNLCTPISVRISSLTVFPLKVRVRQFSWRVLDTSRWKSSENSKRAEYLAPFIKYERKENVKGRIVSRFLGYELFWNSNTI